MIRRKSVHNQNIWNRFRFTKKFINLVVNNFRTENGVIKTFPVSCFSVLETILAIFFLALIILKKIPPAAGSYYYIFLRSPNLDPPGVDFLAKFAFLSLKKKFACGGLAHPGAYYSNNKKSACGGLLFF